LTVFAEVLRKVTDRVPETQFIAIMGTDGIPLERVSIRPDPSLDAVAAEYTTLLRASVSASNDTGLGALHELSIVTDRMATMLVSVTPEYFIFAALAPGAVMGRARFALRMATLALEAELG